LFFQAEDGIRDFHVTGVQTCALPICWGKVGNPAWMETGAALQGYWTRAVQVEPSAPIAFDWYRGFIQFLLDGGHYTWFAPLVVWGEILVGLALILGAFTGIAAFFGGRSEERRVGKGERAGRRPAG